LNNSLCISNLFTKNAIIICGNFYFLVLATILSATAGYILNNVFDRKIDLINSPQRGLFTEKYFYFLSVLSILFFGMALVLGFLISFKIGISILLSCSLLIFYAKYSKKIGIWKPILVSFLTAFSIILVGLFDSFGSISSMIWLFSVWAFLLSMLREIIKDLEDLEGDSFRNSFTSVIQLGERKSFLLLNFLSVFLILSIIISVFISSTNFPNSVHKLIMIVLVGIFIFLLNAKNSNSSNYKNLSLFCKIMMLIGILGMMVY
jgi:4-hydroxybenzoate polyprenyltransferase